MNRGPAPRESALRRVLARCCAATLFALAAGCTTLPPHTPAPSAAPPVLVTDSPLARSLQRLAADRKGQTGMLLLDNGLDAFVARVAAVRAATQRIEVQYYIWHNDVTGGLLWRELLHAADRGVQVSLLLDDLNQHDDTLLTALDAHPAIELRLFNPFAHRGGWRWLDAVGDFGRINRRMHNKLLLADGLIAITGGRNVGDDYFAADADVSFADLDVALAGAVLPSLADEFAAFWQSPRAYPVSMLLAAREGQGDDPALLAALRSRLDALAASEPSARYVAALKDSPLVEAWQHGEAQSLTWTTARTVGDRPQKFDLPPERAQAAGMLPRLIDELGPVQDTLCIASPYFVPGEQGTAALVAMTERGARVRVLTNSLAATDVTAVHAAYARWRERLVSGGVELWELRPDPTVDDANKRKRAVRGIGGSSRASLHAKAMSADRRRVFVGSFNLDPRSANLNSESGVVLDAPVQAESLCRWFDDRAPTEAWRLSLDAQGRLQWHGGDGRVHDSDPDSSWWRRFGVGVLSLLPIDSQL